jgi:hypothetical protein
MIWSTSARLIAPSDIIRSKPRRARSSSTAALFLVLLIALRHVGVSGGEVAWAEALGAFAIARLLTALPITPGGLGFIELGLTADLVVAGGPEVPVVAAVLVFRALTYLCRSRSEPSRIFSGSANRPGCKSTGSHVLVRDTH